MGGLNPIMRGRKPKPTHLKILEGKSNYVPEREPIPDGDLDAPPDWLSDEQKQAWKYAIENAPQGLLKLLDKSILTTWVVAEDLHRRAVTHVNTFGLVTKSPVKKEMMQNPFLSIANRQAQIMMKAAAELGFTPSSRSRVTIAEKSDEQNPFAQFANSR